MFDKMSAEPGVDILSRQREAEEKLKGGRWMGEPLSYLHFLYFVFVFHAFCICICKREAEEKLKGGWRSRCAMSPRRRLRRREGTSSCERRRERSMGVSQ